MILQSLYQLYNRLAEDEDNGLPKPGYSLQNITFRIILKLDGSLVELQDARKQVTTLDKRGNEKTKDIPVEMLVPGKSKPSGQGISPCALWDNLTYLCGFPQPDKDEVKAAKNRMRAPLCYKGSQEHHAQLFSESPNPEQIAVARFFKKYSPTDLLEAVMLLPEAARKGNGVFQIAGHTNYAHSSYIPEKATSSKTAIEGQCLITGKMEPIARLHEPKIKTFDPKGSLLVSFNERAYESFAKEDGRKVGQGHNAPVSEAATFAYCNALNWLLARKERRFRVGDATSVFWTDAKSPIESIMPWMMSGVPEAEDQQTKNRVQEILKKISVGTVGRDELGDPDITYHILGLSPNASRLSVRFWHSGTVSDLIAKLKLHLDQLHIVRQFDETNSKYPDPLTPNAYHLLRQTAREADGIPPQLGGALMRSILRGEKYPESIATAVINRIRAEREITYLKAAILKAWLIRNHKQTITIMLDETNTNPGYRLGRLFAVLEKTQQDALPGIKATIRERFYASASATPRAVFGRLLRTYPHHLTKLENQGFKIIREKQIQEILSTVTDFPAHLNLRNQAQFALGYYHQRKDFFIKKETPENDSPEPQAAH
jgi:CRISPR-associated protein Csd1